MADRQFVVEAIFRAQDRLSAVLAQMQTKTAAFGSSFSGSLAPSNRALSDVASRTEQLARSITSANLGGAARDFGQLASALTGAAAPAANLGKELVRVKELGIGSAEGLLAIQGAAGTADISLRLVASGLTNFRARVIAAQEGTGKAADALRTLGASTAQIKSGFGSTAQALAFVGPALARVTDETTRARLATTLFGQAGRQLVPIAESFGSAAATAAEGASALGNGMLPLVGIAGGVVVALAGLVVAIKGAQAVLSAGVEGARFADSLGDLAEKLGLTTEQVARLNFAASQTDTNLGQLSTATKTIERNLVEAQKAGSEMRANFLALGFTAEELDRGFTSTEAVLLRTADAITSVQSPVQRLGALQKIAGENALQSANFFTRGAAGLRAYFDEADRGRLTITALQAKIGDDFGAAVAKLNLQVLALKAQIGEGVVPSLTSLAGAMGDIVAGADNLTEEVEGLARAMKDLSGVDPTIFFTGLERAAESVIPGLATIRTALDFLANHKPSAGPASPATAERAAGSPIAPIDFAKNKAGVEAYNKALAEEKKAQEAAAEAAKRHAERIAQLRAALDEFIARPSTLVSTGIADRLFEISPEAAADFARRIHEVVETLANDIKVAGIKIPVELDVREFHVPEIDTAALDELPTVFDGAGASAAAFGATVEAAGLSMERLVDRAVQLGVDLQGVAGIGVVVGDSLGVAFAQAFDPMAAAIGGVYDAVSNLRSAFDGAFASAINKILTGQASMLKFTDAIRGAIQAMARLVLEIGAAIIKALILKAIGFGIFSGGGKVSDVGTGAAYKASGGPIGPARFAQGGGIAQSLVRVQHFFAGGAVQRFATGGAVAAALAAPSLAIQRFADGGGIGRAFLGASHAAYGLAIPGAPNRMDNVPIWASQGEFVVPNLGPTSGVQIARSLAGGLETLREVFKTTTNNTTVDRGGSAPVIGTVIVHAFDSDSVRNSVRPGGSVQKQVERSAELGRWGEW